MIPFWSFPSRVLRPHTHSFSRERERRESRASGRQKERLPCFACSLFVLSHFLILLLQHVCVQWDVEPHNVTLCLITLVVLVAIITSNTTTIPLMDGMDIPPDNPL